MPAPKILLELLNDDIISRRKLILKRYRYIGLTEKEAMYFIAASYIDGELITASRLANLLELSKAAVEKTLARSLERKLIKIKFIDDKKSRMIIDISPMMEALLSTYFELPESASLEDQTS
ncbi:MAG: hypothetical protein DRP42_01675 [Tenericutes bacterium]|nr:MAG: hypothetical protein DRP42_01675 [Mycoplasmatota bacterium]